MLHAVHEPAFIRFQYHAVAVSDLLKNSKVSVAMPGDDTIAWFAGHRTARQVPGAAAQIGCVRALDHVQLDVKPRNNQLRDGVSGFRTRFGMIWVRARRFGENACRFILPPAGLNDITNAAEEEHRASAEQQIREPVPHSLSRLHRVFGLRFRRSARPMPERLPPPKSIITQSAEVAGSCRFFEF